MTLGLCRFVTIIVKILSFCCSRRILVTSHASFAVDDRVFHLVLNILLLERYVKYRRMVSI